MRIYKNCAKNHAVAWSMGTKQRQQAGEFIISLQKPAGIRHEGTT